MGCGFSCSLFLYRDIYYLVMAQFRSAFIENCTYWCWADIDMACRYRNLKMMRYNITNVDFRCNMNLRYFFIRGLVFRNRNLE